MHQIVDAMGKQCPIPVVMAIRALEAMTEPGTLEVLVDNETAVQNLLRMASGRALAARREQRGEGKFAVIVEGDGKPLTREEEPLVCTVPAPGDFLVAVDTQTMGRGDEELGGVLMKGFFYALTQLPQPPRKALFYNGGAKLTVEGSALLEDLRTLEAVGTEILTCGTCLNFYGLTERLAVGRVANMYEIVENLASAGKVIKP